MRKTLRTALTFLGIAALFPLVIVAISLLAQTDVYADIFGVRDGAGFVTTYIDENANGKREPSEPPLPGVCILDGYRPDPPGLIDYDAPCDLYGYEVTDDQGRWDRFLPGGDCSMLYVFALPPSGYQSTNTPAASSCSAEFGFVQSDVAPAREFPTAQEFARRERWTKILGRLGIAAVVLATATIGTWWLNRDPRE